MIRLLVAITKIRPGSGWALDKMQVTFDARYSENDSGVTAGAGNDFTLEMDLTADRATILDAVAAELRDCAQYAGNSPECFSPYHPTFDPGEIMMLPDHETR